MVAFPHHAALYKTLTLVGWPLLTGDFYHVELYAVAILCKNIAYMTQQIH